MHSDSKVLAPITLREVARLARIFHASLTTRALRCREEFGVIVGQLEDHDISSLFTSCGVPRFSIRSQLLGLFKQHATTDRGEIECKGLIGKNDERTMYLQWRSTGRHGRKLFLLSDHSDSPLNPDPNWTPEEVEFPRYVSPAPRRRRDVSLSTSLAGTESTVSSELKAVKNRRFLPHEIDIVQISAEG